MSATRPAAEVGAHATAYAPNGIVASADHLATSVGVDLLRRGGTAADAAIAANAVLAVTSPHLCGLGGDLFALVHDGPGPPVVLDAAGGAGSGVDPAGLRADGHTAMPFRGDLRSAPVPGCVDGWLALHRRFGRLPLADVLAPAVALAADGFPASGVLAAIAPLLRDVAGAGDLLAVAGRPGARCRRPGVARALAAIAADGRDGFYGGEFGAGLLEVGAGVYVRDDLEAPLARWRSPVGARCFGHDVWTVPPPSQGYLVLLGAGIAEDVGLPESVDDPRWAHLLVEAAKLAGADRPAVLHEHADPDELLALARRADRVAAFRPDAASQPGPPGRSGDTMFLATADADGLGVSLIQSNAADFGSHVFEPTTGIGLHNRGVGFSLEPGHPAEAGPRRRPPSTLSPCLVTRPDGTLAALVGSMGGDSQPQIVLQLLADRLVAGDPPGTAIRRPRFVLERPGQRGFDLWDDAAAVQVALEDDAPEPWFRGLASRGHVVRRLPALDHAVGHAHLVAPVDGGWSAAADPRAGAPAASGW